MDFVALCPNISHVEGLPALWKRLKNKKEKYVWTDTILDLAEVVLKSNISTFRKKTFKQKQRNAIGTTCRLSYSILFMTKLEEEMIRESE